MQPSLESVESNHVGLGCHCTPSTSVKSLRHSSRNRTTRTGLRRREGGSRALLKFRFSERKVTFLVEALIEGGLEFTLEWEELALRQVSLTLAYTPKNTLFYFFIRVFKFFLLGSRIWHFFL